MKNILFINSALNTKCVALICGESDESNVCGERDGKVLIEDTTGHKKDLKDILEAVQDLCKQASIELADITSVVVVRGPGNFSAIRVGCIVAMSLANNLPCELFAIDSLSLLAVICGSNAVAMNASKTEIYYLQDLDKEMDSADLVSLPGLNKKIVLEKAEAINLENFDLVDFDARFMQEQKISFGANKTLKLEDLKKFLSDANFESFISEYKSSKIIEPLYIKPPNIHVKD